MEEVKAYLESLDEHTYRFVSSRMIADSFGLNKPIPLSGSSCTSQNCCCDGTGCHKATQNGYCACQSADGPCVWIPGV